MSEKLAAMDARNTSSENHAGPADRSAAPADGYHEVSQAAGSSTQLVTTSTHKVWAGIWDEQYDETSHGPIPVVSLVYCLHAPDPILKLGPGAGRNSLARTGSISSVSRANESRWAVPGGSAFRTVKIGFPDAMIRDIAEVAFGHSAQAPELLEFHGEFDTYVSSIIEELARDIARPGGAGRRSVGRSGQHVERK